MGPNCGKAFAVIARWGANSGALAPTMKIAYASWLPLMAGLIAWLRASGRGRCGWEPATVVIVACLPPVWVCVTGSFHPEDLFAMGFALGAMACVRRGWWARAGVLIALAVLSQQFALLVAAPLLVLAPGGRRLRYAAAAAGTAALIALPLLVVSSGREWRGLLLGSGDDPTPGGTVVWHFAHHGASAYLVSRVLPVALALAISWWVVRRLGPARFEPVALMSLVGISLSLRLVFEQYIFAYYFMALAILLVLLDVARGHIRGSLMAWLTALTLAYLNGYLYVTLNLYALGYVLPVAVVALILVLVLYEVSRGRGFSTWNLVLWLGVVTSAVLTWPLSSNPFLHRFPTWLEQVVFVTTGIALAAGPLLDRLAHHEPATERDDLALV
jgi:hypothetical protein